MAANKRAGKKSLASNDFLAPAAPVSVSAVDVGANRPYNNGAATVSFSLPAGSPAATSYTVTSSTGQTGTGASSPITVSGIPINGSVTFTVTATNAAGTSAASSASSAIAITTVADTPTAPSVSSPSGANYDTVSWNAPANGGKAITNYYWVSSDGKAGNTSATSVNVTQEQGTAQTYTVRADNANGVSGTSSNSASVTTFSFVPFSFVPFSVFDFFSVFSFAPFGFYDPQFDFGFAVFGFFSWCDSIAINTKVVTPTGLKLISEIEVGDKLVSVDLENIDPATWSQLNIVDFSENLVQTTVISKSISEKSDFVYIDGDMFTQTHYILARKDGATSFVRAGDIDTSYEKYSYSEQGFVPIEIIESVQVTMQKVSLQCEPYDNFFTEHMLVLDRPDN